MDERTLTDDQEPGRSHLEDGTRVSPETARRLTCDASVVTVTEGADGSVLDVGRKTRTIPPAIRRALYLRDGGCRFPGCGLRFTVGHHVKHWALGGETKLENLVSLCRFHHRAVHEDGFDVRRTRDGGFRFFDHKGWPLPDCPPPTGMTRIMESRFSRVGTVKRWDEVKGDVDGVEGVVGSADSIRRFGQTLERSNRERGIDPQWWTAAARFSGNVDDPRNQELRDHMFDAMDALDPGGVEALEPGDVDALDPGDVDALEPGLDQLGPGEGGSADDQEAGGDGAAPTEGEE